MKHIVHLISFIIGIEATIVIAGWIFGIERLTRVFNIGINMSFPTAVMFLASAIGLLFLYLSTKRNFYILSSLVLTAVTLLIFLINLTLVTGTLTDTQTGMENLFVGSFDVENLNIKIAGIPAMPTMVCFILYCFFIILSVNERVYWKKMTVFVASLIIIIGSSAILGYLIQQPVLYFQLFPNSVPMALNTAISFMLLGLGLVTVSQIKNGNET